MSVLSDRDIAGALQAGRVRIDPYDSVDLQASSVDTLSPTTGDRGPTR